MAPAGDMAIALAPWLCRVDSVTPLAGGWNSSTWLVAADGRTYVAKLVDPLDAPGLDAGLRLAEFAAARAALRRPRAHPPRRAHHRLGVVVRRAKHAA